MCVVFFCFHCFFAHNVLFLPTQAFRENNGTNTANPLAIGSTLGRRIAGLGLFVQRAYRRGERITRYGGRVLSIDEARAMPRRTHMRSLDTLRHVVDGSSGYRTASTSANHATVVGLAQFANTCTDDDGNKINCRAVKEYDSERLNVVAVWLEAARDIALGEELLVSYGRSFHRAVAARSHLAARLWRPANRAGNNALFWPSQRDATTNVVGDDAAVAAATPRYQLRTRKRKYE
jgi:hypothetical protein